MAIFGSIRDITMFKGITREFVEDVASQQIGYYKIMLNNTQANLYGESLEKEFIGPVLLFCLIERGDASMIERDMTHDTTRPVNFRFFKDHLQDANIAPEVGDVIMYNEVYYEVNNVNENQLILGKDNTFAYSAGLENFGDSYSITLNTHYTSPDRLGITKQRL